MWKNNDDDKKNAMKWFDRNIYIYIYRYRYRYRYIYIYIERERKKSKDLVSDKEEIKSNNIIKRYKN